MWAFTIPIPAGFLEDGMYGTVASNATGLVAYYKMNDGSGQTVTDAGSNGFHGTLGTTGGVESFDPA